MHLTSPHTSGIEIFVDTLKELFKINLIIPYPEEIQKLMFRAPALVRADS